MFTPIRSNQRPNDDGNEMGSDSKFYSLPPFNKNKPIPNTGSHQIIIETDTENSKYKTPDSTFYEYGNATSSSETEYVDVPFYTNNNNNNNNININNNNKPSTSTNTNTKTTTTTTTNSNSINSRNKILIMENSDDLVYKDLQCLRGQMRRDDETIEEESVAEFIPKLITENKPKIKSHIMMETYPTRSNQSKKIHEIPANIPLIKENDYQQLPSLLHIFDTLDSSDEKTLNPIYVKYSSKDDLSAKSDSINMLSVVISTVMLLASRSQIPQNYVTWTLKYLKCIKNKQGQTPPNIKKIQKMLTSPTGTGQWQCMDFLTGKNPGKRLDLTKKRKK